MKIEIVKARNIKHPFPVLAWLIMIFQNMKPWDKNSYSHMAIKVTIGGEVIFYDISFSGSNIRAEIDFLDTYRVVESCEITHNWGYSDFLEWFSEHRNKKYDYIQLVGLLGRILNITPYTLGKGDKKLICSELILLLLIKIKTIDIRDTDYHDLISTWLLVKKYGA